MISPTISCGQITAPFRCSHGNESVFHLGDNKASSVNPIPGRDVSIRVTNESDAIEVSGSRPVSVPGTKKKQAQYHLSAIVLRSWPWKWCWVGGSSLLEVTGFLFSCHGTCLMVVSVQVEHRVFCKSKIVITISKLK